MQQSEKIAIAEFVIDLIESQRGEIILHGDDILSVNTIEHVLLLANHFKSEGE